MWDTMGIYLVLFIATRGFGIILLTMDAGFVVIIYGVYMV
jgi:hypothetical protein